MEIKITNLNDRVSPGTWAIGKIGPFEFQALVFPAHAVCKSYELGRSKISKLWITKDDAPVFNFDRGLDIAAKGKDSKAAVALLTKNLAKLVFKE
jgi:hypothetical protein